MNSFFKNVVGLVAVFFAGWSGAWSHGLVSETSLGNSLQVDEIRTQRLMILDGMGKEVGMFVGEPGMALLRVGALDEKATSVFIEAIDRVDFRHARVAVNAFNDKSDQGLSQATLFAAEQESYVRVTRRRRPGYEKGLALQTNPQFDPGAMIAIADGKETPIPLPSPIKKPVEKQ
jgi:hypothetical protein